MSEYILPPLPTSQEIPNVEQNEGAEEIVSSTSTPSVAPSKSKTPNRDDNHYESLVNNVDGELIGTISVDSDNPRIVGILAEPGEDSADPNVVSSVINVIAVDSNGNEIVFSGDAEICLSVDEDILSNESCLGFLDETKNPPRWVCEDPCLRSSENKNEVCGTTNHFTSFAILLQGGGTKKDPCGSTEHDYIFNEAWQDTVFLACFTLVMLSILIIPLALLTRTKFGRRLIYGKEASRIYRVRKVQRQFSDGGPPMII